MLNVKFYLHRNIEYVELLICYCIEALDGPESKQQTIAHALARYSNPRVGEIYNMHIA